MTPDADFALPRAGGGGAPAGAGGQSSSPAQAARPALFGAHPHRLAIALAALIALKLALLFVFAWNSRFIMDEFGQLGYAKYIGNGLFETVQPPKAVGFALFYKLAHLIGWDAQSILLAGRLQTALLACATLAMIHASARSLGHDRVRALAIILVLLSFSNFTQEIFRTRAEQLAVFFAVASLLVILRRGADRPGDVVVAGLLSGLAFLATQKSVYFNLALGLALVTDAAASGRYQAALRRGAWLVLGWAGAVCAYCFIFGGSDPLPIARSLVFGPVEVATRGGAEYGGLRHFVLQTLVRNALLYLFCFAGMGLMLARFGRLDGRSRIALVFTVVITVLVFSHDQPWPYVFVLALPFMALWSLAPFDRISADKGRSRIAAIVLAAAIALSFVGNIRFLGIGNAAQLELVGRAEALIGPDETYFDGIGMLPNRPEPTTLWLDKHYVLATLREGERSEAYQVLTRTPPKIILWSYRMDAIRPVVGRIVRNSYVRVAPNIWMAGRRLVAGERQAFDVPVAGDYRLYSKAGAPLRGLVEIDGKLLTPPLFLTAGARAVTLRAGPAEALLLPAGSYSRIFAGGADHDLFAARYE